MASLETGICPHCEIEKGAVGTPCGQPGCQVKHYHYIPKSWLATAKAYAVKKHEPLDPLLGRFIDRYLLAGKLGEGGMGAVYYSIQKPLGREVALKLISQVQLNERTIARFEREARAIAILDHPNIVKLYDYGIGHLEYDIPYMALEYIRHGRNLRRALALARNEHHGVIPTHVILTIFGQIFNGLNAAHKEGIVHRDMKPDNVMIASVEGQKYMVKILDFGLAKAVGEVKDGINLEVSMGDTVVGTPHYMAPEQVQKTREKEIDFRADLYAVAVMLYEIFTGRKPHDGQNAFEIVVRKLDPTYDPLSQPEAQYLSEQLKDFLRKGLAIDPKDRFSSAEEMHKALVSALAQESVISSYVLVSGSESSSRERPLTPPSPVGYDDARLEEKVDEEPVIVSPPSEKVKDLGEGYSLQKAFRHIWYYLAWMIGPIAGILVVIGLYFAIFQRNEGIESFDISWEIDTAEVGDSTLQQTLKDTNAESITVNSLSFVIETKPSEAIIRIDGEILGVSPQVYKFYHKEGETAKEIEISVSAHGYKTTKMMVDPLEYARLGKLTVELKKITPTKIKEKETVPRL